MTDAGLERILTKDPDRGMKCVIDKYGGLVLSIISGRLRSSSFNSADIEDCASETFFEFWRGFESKPCMGSEIRARLCVIAKRNATDYLRRSYRTPDTLSIDSEAIRSETSIEGDFETKEQRLELIEAIKTLGKPDSEILIRKYYLGQSSKEISKCIGMSVSSIDTRTHRAIDKLKSKFGGAE